MLVGMVLELSSCKKTNLCLFSAKLLVQRPPPFLLALAILEALKKWKHYFANTSVIIRTDQQSLKYIQEQRLVEGI
jgi:hypothetical protein